MSQDADARTQPKLFMWGLILADSDITTTELGNGAKVPTRAAAGTKGSPTNFVQSAGVVRLLSRDSIPGRLDVLVCDPGELRPRLVATLRRLKGRDVTIAFAVRAERTSVAAAIEYISLADELLVPGQTLAFSGTGRSSAVELLARLLPRVRMLTWRVQLAAITACCGPPLPAKQIAASAGITRRSIDRSLTAAGLRPLSTLCRAAGLVRALELQTPAQPPSPRFIVRVSGAENRFVPLHVTFLGVPHGTFSSSLNAIHICS